MKLQSLLACERIIEDPSGGPSLISVFTKMSTFAKNGEDIPSNAVMPKDWAVYTVWSLDEHENRRPYTLRSRLYWPDGNLFADSSIPALPEKADHFLTFTGKANGFPIGQVGHLKIEVWVEKDGAEVSDHGETYIIIDRITAPENV